MTLKEFKALPRWRKEEMTYEIIRNFEWEKVQGAMERLGLKWEGGEDDETMEVPSIARLFTCALVLLNSVCYDEGVNYYSSGGFVARVDDGNLRLEFVLTGWDVEGEEEEA